MRLVLLLGSRLGIALVPHVVVAVQVELVQLGECVLQVRGLLLHSRDLLLLVLRHVGLPLAL